MLSIEIFYFFLKSQIAQQQFVLQFVSEFKRLNICLTSPVKFYSSIFFKSILDLTLLRGTDK